MTKLKTLKDLDVASGSAWLIKEEAIKWVKSYKRCNFGRGEPCIYCKSYIKTFVMFFNITEEDLK